MAEPTRRRSNQRPMFRSADDGRRWDIGADSAPTSLSFDEVTSTLTLERYYFPSLTVDLSVLAGDGGADFLNELGDVTLSGLAARDALMYDGSEFVNRPLVEADISDFGSYSPTGHSHTLADITDSGTAAAADTGTGSSNVPTVAQILAGIGVYLDVLNVSGSGNKLQEIRSTSDGAVQLRLRTDNDNNRRLLGLAQDGSVLTQLIFRDDVVELAGTSNSTDLFCSIGRDEAIFHGRLSQKYTPHTLTDVTTPGQTRTLDVANGPGQTIGATEDFTLDATGPSGRIAEVSLYIHNSSGANIEMTFGAGIPVASFLNVGAGSTDWQKFHWDGTNLWPLFGRDGSGDLRPT